MNQYVKMSIDGRRQAIEGTYDLSKELREKVDKLFKEIEKMGSECKDAGEFETKFTSATIYNILNSRLLIQKPTVISTNLSIEELQKSYSTRFVSRIIGNTERLEFLGRDIRQKLKYKKQNKG